MALGDVSLDRWNKLPEIKQLTSEHLTKHNTKMKTKDCGKLLAGTNGYVCAGIIRLLDVYYSIISVY